MTTRESRDEAARRAPADPDGRASVGVAETVRDEVTDPEVGASARLTASPEPEPEPDAEPGPEAGSSARIAGGRVPPATALVAGAMVGEYRIECTLGEGGMGTVYGAVHPLIGKRAAIKVLKPHRCNDPDALERFVLEARAVNQIGHPNIVDIFSFGELADGRAYFAMEWLRGETLGQRMQRGRLAFGECIEVLDAVILGLDAAHEKGIIHRDLKPDNVFLVEVRGQRPSVKLLDFGIAKLTGGDDQRLERTRTGALIGTPQYISPEQARGFEIDHRTDIYSLGVMAFEMFTGQPPFQADTAMDMIAKHLHDPPPRPSTLAPLPGELDRLIYEMLDKAAANRPDLPSVRQVLDEIRSASVNVALLGTVPDITVPATVRASRQRHTARTAAMVGLGLVALAGGWWATHRTRGRPAAPPVASGSPAILASVDAGVTAPPGPVPPPPPLAATGTLELSITGGDPDSITIDGVAIPPARTVRIERPAGPHEVRVSAPGRKPVTRTVTVIAGRTVGEKVALTVARDRPGSGHDSGSATPGPGSGSGGIPVIKPPPPPIDDDDEERVLSPYPDARHP